MKEAKVLDSAVFQLTPTRTRFELVISCGGVTEKLASGLLKPFLSHLKTAEEQIEKGGYSIVLEVAGGHERSWFTKGTLERFVRFVSTPEVLERVTTIEIEIVQIEESISAQCNEASLLAAEKLSKSSANGSSEGKKMTVDLNPERTIVPFKPRRESVNDTQPVQGENSKVQLLKILENRKTLLQKEQGMAYARAAAAGFDNEHMADLVSFAEYFGALRLRKSCLNIMDMYKRKQEAGLWLEEMEMAAMEDSSTLSEISFAGASGIMLNSNSVSQSKVPAACDDSNLNEFNQTVGMRGIHGNHTNLSPIRDNGISTTAQVPTGIAGSNENIQQSTMPIWPGQPPQYVQNFQSHMVGSGPPLQGFHGLPMQGIQIGSPYYQSYPGNSYWPQFIDNPMFGPPQRTESSGMSNVSAGSKHYVTDETEERSLGSPKSVSLSQGLTDQGGHSELEKERVVRPPKSSHRRSSHRSSNKHSGMVVIRNINYITSKGHDGISEESEPESDSDSDNVIDLSEKKHKYEGELSRKRGSHDHFADGCNYNEKNGKYEVSTDKQGGEDDNSSWQVFQTCLLKDNESSQNNPKNGNGNATHANDQVSVEPQMDVKIKEHVTTENGDLQMISELEANNGEPMSEIPSTMSKEQLLLPQRVDSTWDEKHAVMGVEREKLSIHKKPIIDDSIVISEQYSEIKLAHTVSQWDTIDNIEHTISRNDDQLHTGIHHGQCLVDDSFMVSTRSAPQEQANIEWKTQISMDSELPFIDKGERSSNDAPKSKSETLISWEPADSFMMPERNSERDSLGQSWNPAIDNDIQELVNIVDQIHKYPDVELNGDVGEKEILKKKRSNANVKELSEMKISSKGGQLKATEEALAKRKADTAARSGKKTKLSPLAEAQLRAEKLRAFKAALQRTKNEKEEEDRKRIEELKMQRQKRIAGRTTSIVNKSTSNSQSSKQQLVKPTTTGKLSLSMQKDRTSSNNLSTAHPLPRPITKISNEAIKRLSSHKLKPSGDAPSQSVSARGAITKENSNVSGQLRSVVQAKQIPSDMKNTKQGDPTKVGMRGNLKTNSALPVSPKNIEKVFIGKADQSSSNGLNVLKKENKENGSMSNVKKKSNQGLTPQQGIEGDKLKTNGTMSHSTPHPSDNSDLKKKSAVAKKSLHPVSTSTEKSVEIHLDLKNNVGKKALTSSGGSTLDNGVENIKLKENKDVKFKDSSMVAEIKNHVKATVSDDDSRMKEENFTHSVHFSTQESTFNNVKQPEENDRTTPEGSVDDGFEIIKVSEALPAPLTEVVMSGSLSSKQLENQQSSFKVSSFVLERCNREVHDTAPTAPVSSLYDSPSESIKFCTSSASVTPENGIAREEVFTSTLNVFGSNDPQAISSNYSSASPDLQNVPKSPPSNSPVADDGKSDSPNTRKKWGNSENGAKGLRRFLMFGRKPRSSMSPSANVVSLATTQG